MKRLVATLLAGATLVACGLVEGSAAPTSTTSASTHPPSLGPSQPNRLPPIVLTADLTERPASWHQVAIIPFGPRVDQLGYIPADPAHEQGLAWIPNSFAVGSDGSLWVLDFLKGRVAHYSESGRYLGSVGRLPKTGRWWPVDVTFQGDRLFVLMVNSWTGESSIEQVLPPSKERGARLSFQGNRVAIHSFVPGASQLTVELHGYANIGGKEFGTGPYGWASTNETLSKVRELPGVPLEDGNLMDISTSPDSHPPRSPLDVTFVGQGTTTILPLEIQLVAKLGAKPVEVAVAAEVQGAVPHGLACYVEMSPSRPRDQDRLGGGRWFLQVSEDGSPLVWERLPDPGVPDENQRRNITVDARGFVYRMVPSSDGVVIYRI